MKVVRRTLGKRSIFVQGQDLRYLAQKKSNLMGISMGRKMLHDLRNLVGADASRKLRSVAESRRGESSWTTIDHEQTSNAAMTKCWRDWRLNESGSAVSKLEDRENVYAINEKVCYG